MDVLVRRWWNLWPEDLADLFRFVRPPAGSNFCSRNSPLSIDFNPFNQLFPFIYLYVNIVFCCVNIFLWLLECTALNESIYYYRHRSTRPLNLEIQLSETVPVENHDRKNKKKCLQEPLTADV